MAGQKTLLIGEDSGDEHQNDAIWAYNVESGELTRIASTPYGAETTSLYYYPNVNDFGYIMAVIQHPYGESDSDKVSARSAERRSRSEERRVGKEGVRKCSTRGTLAQ